MNIVKPDSSLPVKSNNERIIIEDDDIEVVDRELNINDIVKNPQDHRLPEVQDFIINYFCPNASEREKRNVRSFLQDAGNGIQKRLDNGETLREDWYGENSNPETLIELLQAGIKAVLNSTPNTDTDPDDITIESSIDIHDIIKNPPMWGDTIHQDFIIFCLYKNYSNEDKELIRQFLSTVSRIIKERIAMNQILYPNWISEYNNQERQNLFQITVKAAINASKTEGFNEEKIYDKLIQVFL